MARQVFLLLISAMLLSDGASGIPLNNFYPFGPEAQHQYFKGGNGRYWINLAGGKIVYVNEPYIVLCADTTIYNF